MVDVLGTWLLSILDGQRRYAHVAGLRGDEVAPQILGMNKVVSDESLRRLVERLAPQERPALVRGDNAFGNEGVMAEMEEIGQHRP